MKKRIYACFLIIICSFLCSCKTQAQKLIGNWQDSDKLLSFDGARFKIEFKNSDDIKSVEGYYDFSVEPSDILKLHYEYFTDKNGNEYTFEGSDLEGGTDFLMYQIMGKTLTTKVLALDKIFIYDRVED